MIGLAVGIDYALFIVSRYPRRARRGTPTSTRRGDRPRRRHRRVARSSSPGLTVVIALAGLSVVGIPFLTEMGLAAAGHRRRRRPGRRHPAAGPARLRGPAGPGRGASASRRPAGGARSQQRRTVWQRWADAVIVAPAAAGGPGHRGRRCSSSIAAARRWTCGSACPTTASPARRPRSARPTTCSPTASARASTAR